MQDEIIKIEIKNHSDNQQANTNRDTIEWQFEDRPITPKSEWLWALSIFGFAIIIFSILLKNYLLIVIVALAAFIIYISKNKTSEFHNFKLDDECLHINGKIYPYENFESFCIFPDKEIALRNKRHLTPLLIIPFNGDAESMIKKILSEHLPESEEEESFLDLLKKRFF